MTDIAPISSYCFSYLVGSLVGQLHMFILLKGRDLARGPGLGLRQVTQRSFPYLVSNLSAQSRMLDVAVVNAASSALTAGLYSAASKILNPFLLLPGVLTTVIMPHVSRLTPREARTVAMRLQLLAVAMVLILIPVALYSAELTDLVLGGSFSGAHQALAWGLLGLPFISLASPLGSVLQSQGHKGFVARNGVIFAVLTLSAAATGAWSNGSGGAAMAVTLTYMGKCLSLSWHIERRLRRNGGVVDGEADVLGGRGSPRHAPTNTDRARRREAVGDEDPL
jgi:O-antigen/teichoic acid export membrane protein